MNKSDISRIRLHNQKISGTNFTKPGEILHWMLAMQAQSYSAVKWAIGSRLNNCAIQDVEKAIKNRSIIRTWLMRGTLHFTAKDDIRWMLSLLAPGLIARSASRNKQLGLDTSVLNKSAKLIYKVLNNAMKLSRSDIGTALEKEGIDISGQRLYHMLHHAALEQIICFSGKTGNEFEFTLLDFAAPVKEQFKREKALAEISKRYFLSRGPATLKDFTAWSGLSVTDAKAGLENIKHLLVSEKLGDDIYLMFPPDSNTTVKNNSAYLLPAFDEIIIGYRDRTAIMDNQNDREIILKNGIINPVIILNGKVVGTWKSVKKKENLLIEKDLFLPLSKSQVKMINSVENIYSEFNGQVIL